MSRGLFQLQYDDDEWAAIVALLPAPADADERFRTDIERRAWDIMHDQPPPLTDTQWLAAWQKVEHASGELWDALATIDEGEPRFPIASALQDLIPEARSRIASMREGPPTPRRKFNEPEVALLVGRLLGLWCHCGGKLKISRAAPGARNEGEITGPLIRFLMTATRPIFVRSHKKPPSAGQLVSYIKKMRDEDQA